MIGNENPLGVIREMNIRRLFELAGIPGQLKIVTGIPSEACYEVETGAGVALLHPYPATDLRAWVWHDVVLVEGPTHRDQFVAYSANYDAAQYGYPAKITCDWTQGQPADLLQALRKWKTAGQPLEGAVMAAPGPMVLRP